MDLGTYENINDWCVMDLIQILIRKPQSTNPSITHVTNFLD